jgi:putative chitinase
MNDTVLSDKNGTDVNSSHQRFDRAAFFDAYKLEFGLLTVKQTEGLESLLSSMEYDNDLNYIHNMAYLLATVKHETADCFHPLAESGTVDSFNEYDPVLATTSTRREIAKRNGNTSQGDGYEYRGRGFIKITWKNNYKKLGYTLGYDLINYPDKVLDPLVAYKIMSYGMRKGIFTGKKLSDYISEHQANYRDARRIIHGIDQADLIKSYAEKFENILQLARRF